MMLTIFFFSRQRSGVVGLDVSQWRGSSIFSFDGANCSSPTAPLLIDPNTHTGHQLYPVSSSHSHTHTHRFRSWSFMVWFSRRVQSADFLCTVKLVWESLSNPLVTHRMIPVQNPTAFPYKTVPKYTDPWACPDHTPALPRTPARSPTNPRSWISQHPHPCWVIWSCFWKHHRKKSSSGQLKHFAKHNTLGMFIMNTTNKLKLQSAAFWGVKNDPKYTFEKIHNQLVFKAICLP